MILIRDGIWYVYIHPPFEVDKKITTHQFRTCVSAIFPWDAILEIHIFGGFSGGPGDSPKGDDDDDDDDDDANGTQPSSSWPLNL